jgi:hypothetical protein
MLVLTIHCRVVLDDGSEVLAAVDKDSWVRPASTKSPGSPLRFRISDSVEAYLGPKEGFVAGIVVARNVVGQERFCKACPGGIAAYRIKLGDGSQVLAARDTNTFVRKGK